MSPAAHTADDRRMDRFVLACAIVGGVASYVICGLAWAAGFAFGAILSWLNFRLLRSGVDAMGRAASSQPSHPPRWAGRGRFLLGLAVALAGLYVIVVLRWAPWQAVLAGLFTAFAGVFLYAIAELFRPLILPPPGPAIEPAVDSPPGPGEGLDPEPR